MSIQAIPMPSARAFGGSKGTSKYNFAELRAGTTDCLVFDTVAVKKTMSKLHSAIGAYKKRGGEGKFAVRVIETDGVQKVGVWRTA